MRNELNRGARLFAWVVAALVGALIVLGLAYLVAMVAGALWGLIA